MNLNTSHWDTHSNRRKSPWQVRTIRSVSGVRWITSAPYLGGPPKRAALLLSLMISTGNVLAATPNFEHDGWPGELIPTFSTRDVALTLHKSPDTASESVALPVKAGEVISNANFNKAASRLSYSQSKVITRQSVMLTSTATVTDFSCRTRPTPAAEGNPVIRPGEQIEYLQYRAEGFILARYGGAICEVYVMDDPPKFSGMDEQPEEEWWILLVDPSKKSLGWLLVEEAQLDFLPRTEGG